MGSNEKCSYSIVWQKILLVKAKEDFLTPNASRNIKFLNNIGPPGLDQNACGFFLFLASSIITNIGVFG
jgi:hypothetical protein